ncbi:MAG TPA: AMP-binding protein, partial [Micromonosporaceae bacterium]|nr:AMP-binding protein [Micromonosporaceae bacterium]
MTTRNAFPPTFAELFEEVVARYPDATAVVAPDGNLTYTQLARRSRRLARRLIADGVGPEDVVAVVTDRSSGDWLTGLLGVLLAGGAYLALDPHYPAERIAFMLRDAAPRLVLHSAALDWDVGDVPTLVIADAVGGTGAGRDDVIAPDERPSPLGADNLAYLVYTSGSTGRPKGV